MSSPSPVGSDYWLYRSAKMGGGHHVFVNGLLFVLELILFIFGSMDTAGDEDVVSKVSDGEVIVFEDSVG